MTSLNTGTALLSASACPQQSLFRCCPLLPSRRNSRMLNTSAGKCNCIHRADSAAAAALTRSPAIPIFTRQRRSSSSYQQHNLSCHSIPNASAYPMLTADMAEGLEAPVQLLYLATLLGFVAVGAYLVVRQVLIRRELEEAAKTLGDRVRQKDATCEDYFELGVILLRKKLFTQATKNLEKAKKTWDGEPDELAQVYNALGFAYFSMERNELAQSAYRQAVDLQPGYVTAWNNLGDCCEKARDFESAYKAYKEALAYAPDNKVAQSRADALKNRVAA